MMHITLYIAGRCNHQKVRNKLKQARFTLCCCCPAWQSVGHVIAVLPDRLFVV